MRRFALLCALFLAPLPLSAQDDPRSSRGDARPLYRDAAAIGALVAPLCDAIEKTGLPPKRDIPVKVVSREELVPVLHEELEPQFRAVIPGVTQQQLDQIVQISVQFYSSVLMCKYGFATKTIYVVPETFEAIAQVQPEVKVLDPEFFRAVFLHELVHACDDAGHDLGRQVAAVKTQEALQALNALVEGHAQAVTRQVLEAEGKSAWFAELEKVLTAEPAGVDPTMQYVLSILIAETQIYTDALRFFEAMGKRKPAPTFGELLANPPKSLDPILFPERYGRPDPEPLLAIDLALERFAQVARREGWTSTQASLSLLKIRSAFALLPRPEVDEVLRGVHAARNVALTPPMADGTQGLNALVIECAGAERGRGAYDLVARLLERKDEAMKTGVLHIASSAYDEPKVLGSDRALHSHKEVAVEGLPQPLVVHTLIVQRGAAVIELTSNGLDVEVDEMAGWAEEMLMVIDLPK